MTPATGRTVAQAYCLLVGLVLVAGGIAGFFADSSFGSAHDGHGELLGFMVNGWHDVVHLVSGLLLLTFRRGAGRARAAALTFGVAYAAVFVWGVISGDEVLGIIPVDAADNVLHAALAATAVLSALASPASSYADQDATATRLTIYRPGRPGRSRGRPLPEAPSLAPADASARRLPPGEMGGERPPAHLPGGPAAPGG